MKFLNVNLPIGGTKYYIMKKTKTPEVINQKQYIVLCDGELWVEGTKQDVIDNFNEDTNAYIKYANIIKVYELGEPIPFSLNTPQINF